jgi:pSer/pThr/pTyr-binding forkhead associated (FHA) protein
VDEEVLMKEDHPEALAVLRWHLEEANPHALYLYEGETVEIGRLGTNDLCLSNPKVSRQHAVIVWRDSAFQIKDLQSRNGTFVNKSQIVTPHVLEDGDMIELEKEILYFYTIGRPESTMDQLSLDGNTIIVPEKNTQPRLVVSSGEQEGRQISLHAQKMVIGRATDKDDWDIDLQGKAISRPHAEISKQGSTFLITDLDSANGTLVNGEWITKPVELENGDIIELGETLLVFRSQ